MGKSTLFNALTGSNILAANYPFATIEPNTGIVPVPDERLIKLCEMYSAKKVTPATVTFVDIAGLVAGASKGEGLGNQFLANIRSCNAIAHVVRAFEDSNVTHVDNDHDAKKDIDVINTELVLADLQTVEKRIPRLDKEARVNPKLKAMSERLHAIYDTLNDGIPVNQKWSEAELEPFADLQLITAKPVIYVFNVDESTLASSEKQADLKSFVADGQCIFVCAKIEHELQELDESDRIELLESYGISSSGLEQLISAAYTTLGLQSYLTAGETEVRAWTIHKGATAPQAAGVIHGDFEKGFIAAQITDYNELVAAGSEAAAKASGKVRTEGKDYTMQPNDIVEFRFNVSK